MALSWSDIKTRAAAFAQEFKAADDEKSQAQTFWIKFFAVFGVDSHRVGVFESRVKKLNKHTGFADYFWPGLLLIEHKSRGENLEIAASQAADYCVNLKEGEHPRYLLVCDFQRFWLQDLQQRREVRFTLRELPQKVSHFAFILGQDSPRVQANDPINDRAVQKLARLHSALRRDGYKRHPLQLLLVRLLFCMFADKTGLFEPAGRFTDLIERGTAEDGSNVGQVLTQLFDELDTEISERQSKTPGWFKDFPYVNGRLFAEKIRTASFDSQMRDLLLDCCYLDWARISPAVFGSMFQHIMDQEGLDSHHDLRRELGAHYTSEENILKLIGPLFLDELKHKFQQAKSSINALFELQKELHRLRFLDPACGCGNFLVITYRELRQLEIDIFNTVKSLAAHGPQGLSGLHLLEPFRTVRVNVAQFSGIEIEEFPAQVAQVAMWLVDHQMNVLLGETLSAWLPQLPLKQSASIRNGDALDLDWAELCPPAQLDYILGNPPFVGSKLINAAQRKSMDTLLTGAGIHGGGVLDFVAAWYIKAAQYLNASGAAKANQRKKEFKDVAFSKAKQASILDEPAAPAPTLDDLFALAEAQDTAAREKIKVAFVSTNSITQGEQVGVLWSWLLAQNIAIEFAHRTFKWSNDASGKAAVHCVIIGFGLKNRVEKVQPKRLFDYRNPDGESDASGQVLEEAARQINPYLVDAPDIVLPTRRVPLCRVPECGIGNKPIDDGNYLFNTAERDAFIAQEPASARFFRPWLGAEEFINGLQRWCLWLGDATPQDLHNLPLARKRIEAVKHFRLQSKSAPTQKLAQTPARFHVENMPLTPYLLIPGVSSERRRYIPIGFIQPETLASNLALVIPHATLYHFGILTSAMHMAWVRYTCGRLESRYRYSANIVYNNFPWPDLSADDPVQADIAAAAQAVLDARAAAQNTPQAPSLAILYDPEKMPAALHAAHTALDTLVDKTYQRQTGRPRTRKLNEQTRVALLFECYQALVSRVEHGNSAG